jgi:RNA polymerase sigma-70 factor, ECF subfamily
MYCKDKGDFEDLFQEISMALWKSYPDFRGRSRESTWTYRVGLNIAITSFRKGSRRLDNHRITGLHHNLPERNDKRLDLQYEEELENAVDTLNKFDKALVLLYLEEKSYKEIGEIMGISESNVGVKINRIKKRLQEIIKP